MGALLKGSIAGRRRYFRSALKTGSGRSVGARGIFALYRRSCKTLGRCNHAEIADHWWNRRRWSMSFRDGPDKPAARLHSSLICLVRVFEPGQFEGNSGRSALLLVAVDLCDACRSAGGVLNIAPTGMPDAGYGPETK